MDSTQPTDDNLENKNGEPKPTVNNKEIDISKLESMVTPEQVLSASVARRRRNISKKRSSSATVVREQTPCRELVESSDEHLNEERAKTPERPIRKVNRNSSDRKSSCLEINEIIDEENGLQRNESHTKESDRPKKKSLTEITQNEVINFLQKAKRTITSSRERRKKPDKAAAKRSQSTPDDYMDEIERSSSFRQFLTPGVDSRNQRRYSTDSYSGDDLIKRKPYRPEVREFVARKKRQRQSSEKIIQILDPKTKQVLITKGTSQLKFGIWEFLKVLRFVPIKDIVKEYKSYKIDMKAEYDKITSLRNKCMNELFLILIFCGLGALMFKFTEGSFENFYKCGVKRVKRDFIDNLWSKSHSLREEDWKSMARTKLRVFEEELHSAHEAGIHSYSGQRSWSFLNAMVYCLTIITTIGYGHMYPTTITGRALTIIYAIFGIPLFLIILTDFGKLFTRCIKFVWSFVRRVYYTGSCRQVRKTAHMEDIVKGAQFMYDIATFRRPSMFVDPESIPDDPSQDVKPQHLENIDTTNTPTTPAPSNFEIDDEFNLPISVAIFLLISYIFSGALIYCYWEDWDFFAAFYFVFISMSTIGFGDYVPRHPICMIVSIIYLVFGLALMSMCINVVQVKISDSFKQASAKIGATMGLTMEEEDGSITIVPPPVIELPAVHTTPTHPE